MKGDKKVIALLQEALSAEFAASRQYLIHSHILRDWGVDKLADYEAKEAADEGGHASKLIARMLFLESVPDVTKMDKIFVGKSVKEILQNDLKLELEAVALYRKATKICEEVGDFVSAELFEELLEDEEGHVDHIETMLSQMDLIGIENFARLQMSAA